MSRPTMQLLQGDCLELLKTLPDCSVDMVLADLPYGTTACKWDTPIPLGPLWEQYRRVCKPYVAVALFGAEPFSSYLRMSNMGWYKYDWVWKKSRSLGFTNAKNKPMNGHELVCVFSGGTTANKSERRMPYYPQGLQVCGKVVSGVGKNGTRGASGHGFIRPGHKVSYVQEYTNYPTQIIAFANEPSPQHSTQKPVPLAEYLIKTYTLEGQTVLDNTMGSGTTGVACVRTHRNFIGVELDARFYGIAKSRIEAELESVYGTQTTVESPEEEQWG